ncbi:MAG: two-component sensor histidine kinase, partial [Lachnospiraceae bacterium]|nr:two-component sensor histidine kinase [Lachnospiraceae bacterium]
MAKLWKKIKKGKIFTSFRSLKTRIFCIIMTAGIVPCIVLHFGILERYLDNTIETRTNEVQTQVRIIADHLITYNYILDNSSDVVNAELLQLSSLYDGRVLIIDGSLRIIKDTYAVSEGKTIISEAIIKCLKGNGSSNSLKDAGYIEIIVPIEDKSEEKAKVVGAMLTSVSTDSITSGYEYIQSRAFLLEMLAMVVIFGFALLLSRKMLKPFEKITDAINDVKNGYTDEASHVTDYIETEH